MPLVQTARRPQLNISHHLNNALNLFVFAVLGLGFQREAARSVSLAVDACTTKHKLAQQGVTATAAEALRRALEAAGEEEVARTKAALGR